MKKEEKKVAKLELEIIELEARLAPQTAVETDGGGFTDQQINCAHLYVAGDPYGAEC